jgi:hypothetical protein
MYKTHSDREGPNIRFDLKNNFYGGQGFVHSSHNLFEALAWPIFFPFGETGWGNNLKYINKMNNIAVVGKKSKPVRFNSYLSHMILQPESSISYVNEFTNREIQSNRFQIWSRAMNYYIVEQVVRNMDGALSYQRNQLSQTYFKPKGTEDQVLDMLSSGIKGHKTALEDDTSPDNTYDFTPNYGYDGYGSDDDPHDNLVDLNDTDDNKYVRDNDKHMTLGGSVSGSIRHLTSCSRNGLYIVSKLGKPTVFITLTVNTEWPEIKMKLGPGQTAFDRPDIVCQVFHQKLEAILANIRLGKYFESNNLVEYEMRVIEYQHRGLPHAHIVVKLSNMPTDDEGIKDWIDKHISTYNPEACDPSVNEEQYRYKELVRNFMLHKCRVKSKCCPTGCQDDKGNCRKFFHKMTSCDRSCFDEKGFPRYKRRSSDLNVVSYNYGILMDWNGHANVCYTENSYTVNYLYSYIFKGNRKVKISLNTGTSRESYMDMEYESMSNEINLHIKSRKICSMDAMFRILGYKTYPAPSPTVHVINAVMPDITGIALSEGKVNDLYIYFMRPEPLLHLTYQQFYEQYRRRTEPTHTLAPVSVIKKVKFVIRNICSDTSKKTISIGSNITLTSSAFSAAEDDMDKIYSDAHLFDNNDHRGSRSCDDVPSDIDYGSGDVDSDGGDDTDKDMSENSIDISDDSVYTKPFKLSGKWVHYELKKRTNTTALVRMERVPLKCGELGYLRMLLLTNPNDVNSSIPNRTPVSYDDLRTISGTKYNTFQETCIAYGLCKDPAYVTEQMREMCLYVNSPKQRRLHFAVWTKEDYPTLHIVNNFDYDDRKNGKIYRSLVEDWILEHKGETAQSIIKNKFLLELHSYMSEDSGFECLRQYGFPTPREMKTELDMEYAKYDQQSQKHHYDALESKFTNTVEQQIFMDWFKETLNDSIQNDPDNERDPIYCFIQGSGGTGKSEILKKVAAYVRSLGLICKVASATGLSASIFDDCSTLHSLFKVGVVEDCDREYDYEPPKLNLTKQRIELLLETKVAIMDELAFTHKVYYI